MSTRHMGYALTGCHILGAVSLSGTWQQYTVDRPSSRSCGTEAELVGLLDSVNQGMFMRRIFAVSLPYKDTLFRQSRYTRTTCSVGAHREGQIRRETHWSYRHQILLGSRSYSQRRSGDHAQGHCRALCQCTDEATAGEPARL